MNPLNSLTQAFLILHTDSPTEDEIDLEFIYVIIEYLLHISENMQSLKSFESFSTLFSDGAAQSKLGIVTVTSDCPPSPHQTSPPSQSVVGDYAHTSVELSHLLTPHALDIFADLACKPVGCHVDFFPQPLSPCSVDPPDCTVLCSSIPDSSPTVNKDQVFDRVGVMQPTYAIIHDECVQESKEEPVVKDNSLPTAPHPLYIDIPYDSAIVDFPCEYSFLDVSTSDRSQEMLDVSMSLHCGEDTSSSKIFSNLSSVIF